jgi:hypothetical protein
MNEAIFRKCGEKAVSFLRLWIAASWSSFSIQRIQETHVVLLHIVRDIVQVALGEKDVI